MATNRTDGFNAFDAFMADQAQRADDIKSARDLGAHSTMKGMGEPLAPLSTAPVGTIPPPISLDEAPLSLAPLSLPHDAPLSLSDDALVAEVLVAAETQVTPNPLLQEDMIELIEESGLLVLEPGQDADDAIEVSSSFLVDDLDGSPDFMGASAASSSASEPELQDFTDDVQELPPLRRLRSYQGNGEMVELERPRLPTVRGEGMEIPLIQRSGLYSENAEYSDGVPRISARARGLSSKTVRVVPARSPKASSWLPKAAIGVVFVAGLAAGVGFAMKGNSPTTPQPAAAETTAAVAVPAAAAADEPAREEPATIAVLPTTLAEEPLAEEPLAEEPLALAEEPVAEEPVAEEPVAEEPVAEESAPVSGPTVRPLDPEVAAQAWSEVGDQGVRVRSLAPEVQPLEPEAPAVHSASRRKAAKKASERESKREAKRARRESEKAAQKPTKAAAINARPDPAAADPGVLMLAAKPPCQIRIDGKTTGLTTPQRVLKLAPGKHSITLVNREHGIRDSFKVSIFSGKKTRIVRDNTNKIK